MWHLECHACDGRGGFDSPQLHSHCGGIGRRSYVRLDIGTTYKFVCRALTHRINLIMQGANPCQ